MLREPPNGVVLPCTRRLYIDLLQGLPYMWGEQSAKLRNSPAGWRLLVLANRRIEVLCWNSMGAEFL